MARPTTDLAQLAEAAESTGMDFEVRLNSSYSRRGRWFCVVLRSGSAHIWLERVEAGVRRKRGESLGDMIRRCEAVADKRFTDGWRPPWMVPRGTPCAFCAKKASRNHEKLKLPICYDHERQLKLAPVAGSAN